MTPHEIELRKKWIDWYHTLGRVDRSDQAIADFWLAERRREREELVKWVEENGAEFIYQNSSKDLISIDRLAAHLKEI